MRTERIDEDIKYFLDKILREEMRDLKGDGIITVTSVKTTKDLKYATVFLSIFGKYNNKTFAKLQKASGYIRRCLSQMLKARNIPELVFKLDDSMEYGAKMDRLIENLDIKKED